MSGWAVVSTVELHIPGAPFQLCSRRRHSWRIRRTLGEAEEEAWRYEVVWCARNKSKVVVGVCQHGRSMMGGRAGVGCGGPPEGLQTATLRGRMIS